MFLQPNDYLVLQQTNSDAWSFGPCRDMTTDEMKKIREVCGATAVFEFCYWSMIEENGKYNWQNIDKRVERTRAAGLKMIIVTPISPPQDLANTDLYGMGREGDISRVVLSLWNQEAREYTRKFILALLERHAAPDINFIYGGLLVEHYLWNAPIYLDRATSEAFRDRYDADIKYHARGIATVTDELREFLQDGIIDYNLYMQNLLVGQHQEIWDHTQWLIALQSEHNGVFARPAVYRAYQEHFPEATRMMMASTYFSHGPGNAQRVNDILAMYDARILVEAQYCKGLREGTTEIAIAGGIDELSACPERWQGQVVSPLSPLSGNTEIEPWMHDVMKGAVDKWRAAKEG